MDHKIERTSAHTVPRPRLPLLTLSELSAEQFELHRGIVNGPRGQVADTAGRLRGPFNAMLFRPRVGLRLEQLGSALRFGGGLPERSREIAILLVSQHTGCAYEWSAHEAAARRAGVTELEMESIRRGAALSGDTWSEHERVLIESVHSMLIDGDLSDGCYARAVSALGHGDVFELSTLVGYYSLLSLQLRVFRVHPLPRESASAEAPSPGDERE